MRAQAAAIALVLLLAACGEDAPEQQPQQQPQQQQQAAQPAAPQQATAGVTPMAERVAVIGLLNKRNGIVRNLTMKPGQAIRVKDAVVRLRACETTAPWEQEDLTGAFVQLEVQGSDEQWRRVFSGWLYKESPSLNVVQHPVYDVWPKSCAMNFPAGPAPDAAPSASSNRSSAQRSPGPRRTAPAEPAPEADSPSPPSAADSNAT